MKENTQMTLAEKHKIKAEKKSWKKRKLCEVPLKPD